MFSLGPDEARRNLSKACLSYQNIFPLLRKDIDTLNKYNLLRNEEALPC